MAVNYDILDLLDDLTDHDRTYLLSWIAQTSPDLVREALAALTLNGLLQVTP
jgi:hypothetical protein